MMKFIFPLLVSLHIAVAQTEPRPSFADSTAATRRVAEQYCAQYLAMNLDSLAHFMHPEISFEDPTAAYIFEGGRFQGKEEVLRRFRKVNSSITDIIAEPGRSIVSSNSAVFEITLRWTFRSRSGSLITIVTPLAIVVTVSGGLVIEHRDYGDYTTFREQYERQITVLK